MDSKRLKISAIVTIIFVIVASLAVVLWIRNPEQSEARTMMLLADDVTAHNGGYWRQGSVNDETSPQYENTTSEAYSYMWNESISIIFIRLSVFDTEENCQSAFPSWNTTEHPIGDESVYLKYGEDVKLVFRHANLLVFVWLDAVGSHAWLYDSAVYLAELQLEKIHQFLDQRGEGC